MNHFSALPERRANLIVREDDLLAKIDQLFTKSNTVLLFGSSGVGKSTLANEYAHSSLKKGLIKEAKWFESDCVEKLEINYIANMIPPEMKHLLTEKNKNLVIQEINRDLHKYTDKSLLLIIFDGISNFNEALFELIHNGLAPNVRCLITTTQTKLKDVEKLGVLEVKPLNRKEAELLLSKSVHNINPELTNELIKLCGQLLLPLKLNELSMVFGYFKEKSHGEILRDIIQNGTSKSFIHVMLKDLYSRHPEESDLIKCIAFVDSDCISKLFMASLTKMAPERLDAALNNLKKWSILENSNSSFVKINRNLQLEIIKAIETNDRVNTYLNLLNGLMIFNLTDAKHVPSAQEELIKHVCTFLSNFNSNGMVKTKTNLEDETYLHDLVSDYFENKILNYRISLIHYEIQLKIFEQLQHPGIANVYSNIGISYQNLFEYKKSIDFYLKAIDLLCKEATPSYPNIAVILNNVGHNFKDMNEIEKSIEYYRKALDIHMNRTKQVSQYEILNTLSFLDISYRLQNDHEKLIKFYLEQIEIFKTLNKRDEKLNPYLFDASIASCLNNLGILYRVQGGKQHLDASIKYYFQSIEYYKKLNEYTKKDTHEQDIATVLYNAGISYQLSEEYTKSNEYLNKALDTFLKRHSSDPIASIYNELSDTYSNIGKNHESLGDYPKALENYLKCIDVHAKAAAENIVNLNALVISYYNVGKCYFELKDYQSSVYYYIHAYEEYKNLENYSETNLANFLNNIGNSYFHLEQHEEAIKHFSQAYEIYKKNPVQNLVHLEEMLNYIGTCYYSLEKYDKSIDHFKKSMEISNNKENGTALNSIGNCYYYLKDYEKSISHYEKALNLRIKENATTDLGQIYSNIAICHLELKNYSKAAELYSKSLEAYAKIHDPCHPDIEETLSSLATCYQNLGDTKKEIECSNKLLAIKYKVYDADHPLIAETLNKIGKCYQLTNDTNKAAECFGKALDIYKKSLEANHPSIVSVMKSLEGLHVEA